jgi:hypothetical protein
VSLSPIKCKCSYMESPILTLKIGEIILSTKEFSLLNTLLLIGFGASCNHLISKNLPISFIFVQDLLVHPFMDLKKCKVTEEMSESFSFKAVLLIKLILILKDILASIGFNYLFTPIDNY